MTSIDHITARATGTQTRSFGIHRQSDRPASAIRAGATSMPDAWQSRGTTFPQGQNDDGAPVRSFADMLLDPLRWVTASKIRAIGTGLVCLLGLIVWL